MKTYFSFSKVAVILLLLGVSGGLIVPFGSTVHAQDPFLQPATNGGGRKLPKIPKPNCNFLFAVTADPAEAEYCVGDVIAFDAVLVGEGKGPGSYSYEWEIVGGSQLQIQGNDDLETVFVLVTGSQNTNTLKLTVTREGCSDDILGNDEQLILTNVDTQVPVPSVSMDLVTCGGFPNSSLGWSVVLNASPASAVASTVWNGGNITFTNPTNPSDPNTTDFGVLFTANSPGELWVSVAAYNKCGAGNGTSEAYDTGDCGNTIFNRVGDLDREPVRDAKIIQQGSAFQVNQLGLENASVRIVNLMGQEILSQPATTNQKISTASFEQGLYLVQLTQGSQVVGLTKLLVQ